MYYQNEEYGIEIQQDFLIKNVECRITCIGMYKIG